MDDVDAGLITAISRALCKADGTAQCADMCLFRFAGKTNNGMCPEAERVWERKVDALAPVLAAQRQALADAERRAEGAWREGARWMQAKAARVASHACLVDPDGGSPTKEEAELCAEAARFIRENITLPAAAAPAPATGTDGFAPTHRHVKRGTLYQVIAQGELQATTGAPREGQAVILYRGEDGKVWAREEGEFNDGRFVALAQAPS